MHENWLKRTIPFLLDHRFTLWSTHDKFFSSNYPFVAMLIKHKTNIEKVHNSIKHSSYMWLIYRGDETSVSCGMKGLRTIGATILNYYFSFSFLLIFKITLNITYLIYLIKCFESYSKNTISSNNLSWKLLVKIHMILTWIVKFI